MREGNSTGSPLVTQSVHSHPLSPQPRRQETPSLDTTGNLSRLLSPKERRKEYQNLRKQFEQFKTSFKTILKKDSSTSSLMGQSRTPPNPSPNNVLSNQVDPVKPQGVQHNRATDEGKDQKRRERKTLVKGEVKEHEMTLLRDQLCPLIQRKLMDCLQNLLAKAETKLSHTAKGVARVQRLVGELQRSKIRTRLNKTAKLSLKLNSLHKIQTGHSEEATMIMTPKCISKERSLECLVNSVSLSDHSSRQLSEKRFGEESVRRLAEDQRKNKYLLAKKTKLIQVLSHQLQELEVKAREDMRLFQKAFLVKEKDLEMRMGELIQRNSELEYQSDNNEYLVRDLRSKVLELNTKCVRLQAESGSIKEAFSKTQQENACLDNALKRIQEVDALDCECQQKVPALESRIESLVQQLQGKEKQIRLDRRCAKQELVELERELKTIDEGFTKLKTQNQILKDKLAEAEKQNTTFIKQLIDWKRRDKRSSGDTHNQDHDVELGILRCKVDTLERMVDSTYLERQKLIEGQHHSQLQMKEHRDEYISRLESQLTEKNQRIWVLEKVVMKSSPSEEQPPESGGFTFRQESPLRSKKSESTLCVRSVAKKVEQRGWMSPSHGKESSLSDGLCLSKYF